jgi:hypothetical protein
MEAVEVNGKRLDDKPAEMRSEVLMAQFPLRNRNKIFNVGVSIVATNNGTVFTDRRSTRSVLNRPDPQQIHLWHFFGFQKAYVLLRKTSPVPHKLSHANPIENVAFASIIASLPINHEVECTFCVDTISIIHPSILGQR